MKPRIISADNHVMEPPGTFVERVPGALKERVPRFVKAYADLRATLSSAAAAYAEEVRSGAFPAAEHSFGDPTRD